jgi:flavorubredoxin
MMLKFDWLEGAETEPLRTFLDEVFRTYDVQTIAPSHGCILEGADVVQRHRAMVDAVLRDVGAPVAARAGQAT